jgi:3-oxoacyl-[acyl-carrier-protein] synthase I
MRRVVVTGMGIVSCVGNNKAEVLQSLQESRSGIEFMVEMQELGLRCQVGGRVKDLDTTWIGEGPLQTMSDVAKYAAVAALEALDDAELPREALHSGRVGVIVGTSGGGVSEVTKAEALYFAGGDPTELGTTGMVKLMGSSAALNLASSLGVRGRCYAVSTACAAGTDSIGHAFELIRHGILDLCLCGGSEEAIWRQGGTSFDNFGGLASAWNGCPEKACRPYDRDRQGTVFSEGAGILVLEPLEQARGRGAQIYAEVIGYGSANDGADLFEPSGRGLKRCIQEALTAAAACGSLRIDYLNSHAAGTKVGDPIEAQVIREVFGSSSPLVSSTKGLSGHSQGATGAHEAIFTLLMLQHNFVAPTVNLDHIAPECGGIRHVQDLMERPLTTAMTFNAGFGGTNACLILRKL